MNPANTLVYPMLLLVVIGCMLLVAYLAVKLLSLAQENANLKAVCTVSEIMYDRIIKGEDIPAADIEDALQMIAEIKNDYSA